MNREELKLTEYLHNIIEDNITLRRNNDVLWKQKLEYIGRLEKAIDYIKENMYFYDGMQNEDKNIGLFEEDINNLLKILKGDE